MKILLILLCSTLISCTSVQLKNLSYVDPDGTELKIEELIYYNSDAKAIAELIKAVRTAE